MNYTIRNITTTIIAVAVIVIVVTFTNNITAIINILLPLSSQSTISHITSYL